MRISIKRTNSFILVRGRSHMTSSPKGGGGGGFQMMTIDDEGEGGVLPNDDVITGTTIFW